MPLKRLLIERIDEQYIPAFEILSEMTLLDDPEICTDAW
jgi:hypothetical protein